MRVNKEYKSSFYFEINKLLKIFNIDKKYQNEKVITLVENVSHLDNKDLYIRLANKKLNNIIEKIFQLNDDIIFCSNIYLDKENTFCRQYKLKLRRYLRKIENINMVSTFTDEDIIEHYYTKTKYSNIKIKSLILDIVNKDLVYQGYGLETVFIINKSKAFAIALYDDREVFIEY